MRSKLVVLIKIFEEIKTSHIFVLPVMQSETLIMTSELFFLTNSNFDNVTFDKDANSWRFYFADKIYVNVYGFWRLLVNNKIIIVSFDNEQQFGLSQPLNLVEELTRQLTNTRLTKIEVLKDTSDLILTLTDRFKLEIYIASSGYESYDFAIHGKRYIGLGSGNIAIFNNQH